MYRSRFVMLHIPAVLGVLAAVGLLAVPSARCAPLDDIPGILTQPDGSRVSCRLTGDEFSNVARDANGFTLIQDPVSGWWVYAKAEGGALAPTPAVAGIDDPVRFGLSPGLLLNASVREGLRAERKAQSASPSGLQPAGPPKTGHIDNLVLFIRFADDTEFPASRPAYESLFNGNDGSTSLRDYYQEVSYGKLDVLSWFVPVTDNASIASYKDSHPRAYFLPYNAATNPIGYDAGDARSREQEMLLNALASATASLPEAIRLDANGDQYLDHVTFVFRGAAGPWSGVLWPHMGTLPSDGPLIDGVKAGTYNVQIEDVLLSGNLGTLCHEFFHGLGAPDLYHYMPNGIDPVGVWDLMGYPARIPQHMGAYMKWKYGGWLENLPTIASDGEYVLKPLTSPDTNGCRINAVSTTNEYFVLEYRRREGIYESSLVGEGLLVYRINPNATMGNIFGPPDEVFIYRPGGTWTNNGTLRDAVYSAESGRTRINNTTSPNGFLSNGSYGWLNIEGIGSAGDTISFTAHIEELTNKFQTQPRDSMPGRPFAPPVKVTFQSASGQAANVDGPVTVSLETVAGPTNARLLGKTVLVSVNGAVEFANLAVDSVGVNFVLRVKCPGMEDLLSNPFSTAGNGVTQTVMVNSGMDGIGFAQDVAISGDGAKVAFTHTYTRVQGDPSYLKVYVRDFPNYSSKLVSENTQSTPASGNSGSPGISRDGRYVVFTSEADNLVASDTNGVEDVFRRNLYYGLTENASIASDRSQANSWSSDPSISDDGEFVAFTSSANNLVPDGAGHGEGIYLRHMWYYTTERVSLTDTGVPIDGPCARASMSADGRYVAFESAAGKVVGGWTPAASQIYVRNRVAQTTFCASLSPGGLPADGACVDASISRDGRYVAFTSSAGNLAPGVPAGTDQVYVHDMATGNIVCASVGATPTGFAQSAGKPSISGDGSRVAFQATGQLLPEAPAATSVYVRDLLMGKTLLASCSTGGTFGNGPSSNPALSADGRWVAFISAAWTLVPSDTNGRADAFRRGPLIFVTVADAARALRLAAGLSEATDIDLAALSPLADWEGVSLADAVRIVRQAQGM